MSATLSLRNLWESMPADRQHEACIDFWESDADPYALHERPAFVRRLARLNQLHPKFLERQPLLDRARVLCARVHMGQCDQAAPIRSWLLTRHALMLGRFLDLIGFKHERGLVKDAVPAVDVPTMRRAVAELLRSYPPEVAGLYLGYLVVADLTKIFTSLPDALAEEGVDIRVLIGLQEGELPACCHPALPPDNEFTTLDTVITKAIVATAFGEEGALRPDQIEDLVDEAVGMSATRHRTLFHRGFLHALLDKPFAFHFPGENDLRRLWYFTGVLMGLQRSGDFARCLALFAEQHQITNLLCSSEGAACGSLLLGPLHRPLVEAGRVAVVCSWARAQLGHIAPDHRPALLTSLEECGEELLAKGSLPEATMLLEFVRDVVNAKHGCPRDFAAQMRPRNARRLAQVLQARGDFDNASTTLRALAASACDEDAARALGDLGLVQGGFRTLQNVLPRSQEEANTPLVKALEKGRASFDASLQRCESVGVTAHLCLGLRAFAAKPTDPGAAVDQLRRALEGMVRDEAAYREGGLQAWTRFCLGIALLESLDSASLQWASELIGSALEQPTRFPDYLWSRTLQAASLFDDRSLAERIGQRLVAANDSRGFELLGQTGMYRHTQSLRGMYLGWLCRAEVPIDRRWNDLLNILRDSLSAQDLENAQEALDAMEGIAVELASKRRELIAMLEIPATYSPAWEPSDADAARTRLLEIEGQYDAAAQVVLQRFHRARAQGGDHQLDHAKDLLDMVAGYAVPGVDVESYRRLLPARQPSPVTADPLEPLRAGAKARVLYVGGNEKQRACEEDLAATFRTEYPGLEVAFIFPGFTSNWHVYVDEVKRLLPTVDAVVLSFLVRTQFGRHVRAMCGESCPWFPCTGRGRLSMRSSIERAAGWAVGRRAMAPPAVAA